FAHTRVAVHPIVGRPYQDGQDAHTNEHLGDVKPTHELLSAPIITQGCTDGACQLRASDPPLPRPPPGPRIHLMAGSANASGSSFLNARPFARVFTVVN